MAGKRSLPFYNSMISHYGEVPVSNVMFVFCFPFSAVPHKVKDTGREHHFHANKDVSSEIVTPADWHMGCCDQPAINILSFSGTAK